MNDFYDIYFDDGNYQRYEAECQGCDMWGPVDDIGLCDDCAGKLERDMIKKREWAYSALAFGCPREKLEDLRKQIVKKHGKAFVLICEDKPAKKKSKKRCRQHH